MSDHMFLQKRGLITCEKEFWIIIRKICLYRWGFSLIETEKNKNDQDKLEISFGRFYFTQLNWLQVPT